MAIRRSPKQRSAPTIVVAMGGRRSRLPMTTRSGPRDGGNFGQEDIAHHATADAGYHPERHRHDGFSPNASPFCAPETTKSAAPRPCSALRMRYGIWSRASRFSIEQKGPQGPQRRGPKSGSLARSACATIAGPSRYRWARGLARLRIPRDSGKRPTAN